MTVIVQFIQVTVNYTNRHKSFIIIGQVYQSDVNG